MTPPGLSSGSESGTNSLGEQKELCTTWGEEQGAQVTTSISRPDPDHEPLGSEALAEGEAVRSADPKAAVGLDYRPPALQISLSMGVAKRVNL